MIAYRNAYFDTAPITYYLEQNESFFDNVSRFMDSYADTNYSTSVITVMEYLVHPYRNHDVTLVKDFYGFLNDFEFNIVDVDNDIAELAAKIRASYPAFKGMDALQLASAQHSGCDVFVTNDRQLKQYKEIAVEVISDF